MLWDGYGTYGFSSLSEKTRKSSLSQMQNFLFSYSKMTKPGLKRKTCDLPLTRPVLSQLSKPGGGIPKTHDKQLNSDKWGAPWGARLERILEAVL